MINKCFLFGLYLWLARDRGVDGDEVKSVSVMEGDSVTLHTDITQIQPDIQIMWSFDQTNRIAEIIIRNRINSEFVSVDGIFRDHLQMNNQTGSLTITNIRTEHTGLYKLTIIRDKISYTSFTVIVYAPLPIPVITRDSSKCSSSSSSSNSNCSLLCSALNVRDANLSWYKGNSLLSIISVSDLNIRLSLPLEVEYQDTNTYSCVLNNPITNQTQHLNITHLCQPCSALTHWVWIVVGVVILLVVSVVLAVIYLLYFKHKGQEVQTDEEEIQYADTTFCAHHKETPKPDDHTHTVYSCVL